MQELNIELNILDYVSSEEIKDAVLGAIKSSVAMQYSGQETELNRMVTDISYELVFEMVNKQFDGNLKQILKDKTFEIINDLSSYTVFRRKSEWEKEDSIATKILNEECANLRPIIKQKVEEIVDSYPFNELRKDEIADVIHECIMNRLFEGQ